MKNIKLFYLAVVLAVTGITSSYAQSTVKDIDGNVYNTVKIGNQLWLKENLKVTKLNDGTPISNSNETQKLAYPDFIDIIEPRAWVYKEDPKNNEKYGKLYNWYAVNDPRGLAPVGWHIPTDAEWTALTTFLGFTDVAGGKMKATGTLESGTGLWKSPNASATNSSGFSALPGGYIADNGSGFFLIDRYGYWWSTTEFGSLRAIARILNYTNGSITTLEFFKDNGFSVRCIKN